MNRWTFRECFTIDLPRRVPNPGFGDYVRHLLFSSNYTAVLLYRLSRYFKYRKFTPLKKRMPFLSDILCRLMISRCGCDIDQTADIGEGFMVDHSPGIVIGAHVRAGKNFTIFSGSTLGAKGLILDPEEKRGLDRFPVIGDDVTILYRRQGAGRHKNRR